MPNMIEKLLSHFRAIEMLHIANGLVKDHSLRHKIEDVPSVVPKIEETALELVKSYKKIRAQLENDDEVPTVFMAPNVDEMTTEERAQLKSQLSRTLSLIDKKNSEAK